MPDLPRTRAPQHPLQSTAKETLMNLAYVTETVIGLALVSKIGRASCRERV